MPRKIFISVIIFFISVIGVYAEEYKVVRGIMDIHSNISGGLHSLERIAELAQEKEISVIIFADSALSKWEYGLWPLRGLIKKIIEKKSVLRLGIERYLKQFTELKKKFPALVIIPGLEASPFYYWQGNPLSKNFSLNDYHKRFLIIGLNCNDYQNIPIIGNRSRFNQYQGKQGIRPYQTLIDYVNQKGGLIFWVHPEMANIQRYKGIEVYTPEHPEDLFLSRGYTGFSITFTDRLELVEAGGVWDKLLLEYIQGKRKKPVWIIGTLHYDGISRRIDEEETLFFVKETRQEDILDAARAGRMYIRFNLGEKPVVLREFSVKYISSDSVQITIEGTQSLSSEPIRIELIRNGKVFKKFEEARDEWTIVVDDNLSAQETRLYYRLKIGSSSSLILSNPVFAEATK